MINKVFLQPIAETDNSDCYYQTLLLQASCCCMNVLELALPPQYFALTHKDLDKDMLCVQDHLTSQRLVFRLCCSQLLLFVSQFFLCFLTGAPQTFHLLSQLHSALTVLQKGFLQRKVILLVMLAIYI